MSVVFILPGSKVSRVAKWEKNKLKNRKAGQHKLLLAVCNLTLSGFSLLSEKCDTHTIAKVTQNHVAGAAVTTHLGKKPT